MGSGSSESAGKAVNVELDIGRIVRLGFKVLELLSRKSHGRHSREVLLNEYWALRFAVLFYESVFHVQFDNEAEVVSWLKEFIARHRG